MTEKYHVLVEWMSGEGAYKMFQYSVSGDNNIGYADEEEAQKVVDFLNQETAPLHEQIAKLKAENAKLRDGLESAKKIAENIWQVAAAAFLDVRHNDYSKLSKYLGLISVATTKIYPEMRDGRMSQPQGRKQAIEALEKLSEESEASNEAQSE